VTRFAREEKQGMQLDGQFVAALRALAPSSFSNPQGFALGFRVLPLRGYVEGNVRAK
jgi:hypothetical protein